MTQSPEYMLITSAYNEEAFVDDLVAAVAAQTRPPVAWYIVDDGSTDSTRKKLENHAREHAFIRVLCREFTRKAGYLSKVEALNLALTRAGETPADFIGILDADVTMGRGYFEELLQRLIARPDLGITGGSIFYKNGHEYVRHRIAPYSVSGAVQFFRREVFRAVTPFRPFKYGGEDAACTILARSFGWKTGHFRDLHVYHHRSVGLGPHGHHAGLRFRKGIMFFDLGFDPLFHAARAIARLWERPRLIGSMIEIAGFTFAALRRRRPILPTDAVRFLRHEQRRRIAGSAELSARPRSGSAQNTQRPVRLLGFLVKK